MLQKIKILYLKDVKEIIRDKKTLILSVLVPLLLLPGMIIGQYIANAPKKDSETIQFYIIGDQSFSTLIDKPNWKLKSSENWQKELRKETLDIVFEVPDNFLANLNNFKKPEVKVYYNNLSLVSVSLKKALKILEDIQSNSRGKLAEHLNLNSKQTDAIRTPFIYKSVGIGSKDDFLKMLIGIVIATFVIIASTSGMTYPVLDIGAGEKERGTLETVLTAPVSTITLSIAKSLVVFSSGMVSMTLIIASFLVLKSLIGLYAISIVDGLLCFIVAIPFVLIISPIFLLTSVIGNSYKEAQGYLSTVMLLSFAPIAFIINTNNKIENFIWIPAINSVFAIKEIIQNTFNPSFIFPILVTSGFAYGALIFICSVVYKRKSLL